MGRGLVGAASGLVGGCPQLSPFGQGLLGATWGSKGAKPSINPKRLYPLGVLGGLWGLSGAIGVRWGLTPFPVYCGCHCLVRLW